MYFDHITYAKLPINLGKPLHFGLTLNFFSSVDGRRPQMSTTVEGRRPQMSSVERKKTSNGAV